MLMLCVSLSFAFHLSPFTLMAQYKVVHLDKPYNTAGSETGALRVGDTVLVFSSMAPSQGGTFGFGGSIMQLHQSRIARDGRMARPRLNRWGLNSKKDHTGNLTIDPLNHDLYFTRGDIETLRCELWYAQRKKRGWDKPARLRGAVNDRGYTFTHPAASRLPDSTMLLYFVSDRPGGMGGMDLWYTLIRDGVASEPVNLGPHVNTEADEITPFYDQRNGILYFSSDRMGGKGGFDIYCAIGYRNTWQKVEAVCGCLNSEQNDLYFTITDYEPTSGFPVAGYLSSNRADSYFLNDSMCCNDLYHWSADSVLWGVKDDTLVVIDTQPTIHYPLALFFHNDDPDPGSRDSVTRSDYADCQLRYALMRSEYMRHQHTADDSTAMQLFFDSCVVGNFDRLQWLFDFIVQTLDNNKRVVLTVSGHASPVFTNDYNLLLSARRIDSFINMIRAWRGGRLADALSDGRLRIVQQPMGADNTKFEKQNSEPIFSLSAAMARRIEIISCEIF